MAGVFASTAPAAPPGAARSPRYVISHKDGRTDVEVDGKPVRFLTGLSVGFEPATFPRLDMSFGLRGGDLALDDACVAVKELDLPDPVARALYEHLRTRYGTQEFL